MAANNYLVPPDWRSEIASLAEASLDGSGQSRYYLFAGNPVTENGQWPVPPDASPFAVVDAWQNMMFGKVIGSSDVSPMIRNIPYVSGDVYTRYDDRDVLHASDNFYAVVNAASYSHVWKCLDNANGAPSTVTPDVSHINTADQTYRTADGYVWYYMYSVDETTITKFGTVNWFPVVANVSVQTASVPGAIDVISTDIPGYGYGNHFAGVFDASQVKVNGNTVLYALTDSSQVAGFYTGCLLYISGGTGVGQYRTIIDSYSTSNGNYIVVESPFAVSPRNHSTYEINPQVVILGPGNQTVNAVARAVVNSAGNTVAYVEMIERGAGYVYASAKVVANAVVGVANTASVRPIYSPLMGHGADPLGELQATAAAVSLAFSNSESGTIPAFGQYQQIGILKDPLFDGVTAVFSQSNGFFIANEPVSMVEPRFMTGNVIVAIGNNMLVGNATAFDEQFATGDWVYLISNTGTHHQAAQVTSVPNATHIALSSNALWSDGNSSISLTSLTTLGTVSEVLGANSIMLTDVPGHDLLESGAILIGMHSGAEGTVGTLARSGIAKNFNTFVQSWQYSGNVVSGTFEPNEHVFQGSSLANSTANAVLFGVGNSFFLIDEVGVFETLPTALMIGAASGATANLSAVHEPEVIFGSGSIVYLENFMAVPRANNQTEHFTVVLKF